MDSPNVSWLDRLIGAPTLDQILNNNTVTPYSLHDLRLYLFTIEHSVENLEFLMWFDQYQLRFNNSGKYEPKSWKMDWTRLPYSILFTTDGKQKSHFTSSKRDYNTSHSTSDMTMPKLTQKHLITDNSNSNSKRTSITQSFYKQVCPLNLPFGVELNDIVNLFLAPCAPLELNLPYTVKRNVLTALQTTTHPNALLPIAHHVHQMLLTGSYPAFISFVNRKRCGCGAHRRLTIPTFFMILGFTSIVIFIVTNLARWYRLLSFPFFFLGILILSIAGTGPCFMQLLKIFPTTFYCNASYSLPDPTNLSTTSSPPPLDPQSDTGENEKSPVAASPVMGQWGSDPFYAGSNNSIATHINYSNTAARPAVPIKNPPCTPGHHEIDPETGIDPNNTFPFTCPKSDPTSQSRHHVTIHHHGWSCITTLGRLTTVALVALFLSTCSLIIPTFPINQDPLWGNLSLGN